MVLFSRGRDAFRVRGLGIKQDAGQSHGARPAPGFGFHQLHQAPIALVAPVPEGPVRAVFRPASRLQGRPATVEAVGVHLRRQVSQGRHGRDAAAGVAHPHPAIRVLDGDRVPALVHVDRVTATGELLVSAPELDEVPHGPDVLRHDEADVHGEDVGRLLVQEHGRAGGADELHAPDRLSARTVVGDAVVVAPGVRRGLVQVLAVERAVRGVLKPHGGAPVRRLSPAEIAAVEAHAVEERGVEVKGRHEGVPASLQESSVLALHHLPQPSAFGVLRQVRVGRHPFLFELNQLGTIVKLGRPRELLPPVCGCAVHLADERIAVAARQLACLPSVRVRLLGRYLHGHRGIPSFLLQHQVARLQRAWPRTHLSVTGLPSMQVHAAIFCWPTFRDASGGGTAATVLGGTHWGSMPQYETSAFWGVSSRLVGTSSFPPRCRSR